MTVEFLRQASLPAQRGQLRIPSKHGRSARWNAVRRTTV